MCWFFRYQGLYLQLPSQANSAAAPQFALQQLLQSAGTTLLLAEENPVLLSSQHRNQVGCRVGRLVRLKLKAILFRGPHNRRARAEKRTFEVLRRVFNVCRRQRGVPFHVEAHLRMNGKDPRNRRSGDPQPLGQRIGKIVVVENVHAMHTKAGLLAVKVHCDCVVPYGNHPEYVVAVNMYVVVVNLRRERGRSNRTGVKVKSNKSESALMLLAVRAEELSLAEAHVCLERQPARGASRCVCSSPAAPDVC